MSLPEERSSYMEPLSPIGRMQSGFAALFVTPSPKKQTEKLTELLMTNPTLTRGSCRPQRLKKVIQTMVQVQKKTDGNANQVVDYKPFVDKIRKPLSMTAVKVNLHNGEHTLIPVTVKIIHSAVQDCEWFAFQRNYLKHQ